ncbi:MAG: alanine--tRNA ligase, partial [Candidatus Zixiibacteriota bacterium]
DMMGETYPELLAKKEHIALVIKSEEERFEDTLDLGIELFEKVVDRVKSKKEKTIPGEEAFKLYDTYGFPLDLTQVMAREKGLSVDLKGFEKELEKQRQRSKKAERFVAGAELGVEGKFLSEEHKSTEFEGYEACETESQVIGVYPEDLILDKTPFYAEAGGQISDIGWIVIEEKEYKVDFVYRDNGFIRHRIAKERLSDDLLGKKAQAKIDLARRRSIQRNHTATHLLHRALKDVLGEHVNQSGSLVAPDRLRFDFTHFKSLDEAELDKVESIVNQKIWENLKIETFMKKFDEAKKMGAVALFGEKYEDTVRVVKSGDFSMELCGGTHVNATGEIGLFKIISETSIAAGIRRIEAVTGEPAYRMVKEQGEVLKDLEESLKTKGAQLKDRVEELLKKNKQLEKKLKTTQAKTARVKIEDLEKKALKLDSINIIAYKADVDTKEALLELGDAVREKLKSTVGVLSAVFDNKIAFVAVVTDDLIKEKSLKAGDIVREVAQFTGGSGGGKPHLAQAGGKDVSKLDKALKELPRIVKRMLK